MPITYTLDRDAGRVRTRCIGPVTLGEVMEHLTELEREPGLPKTLDVLLDLSEMTSAPETDQIRAVAEHIGKVAARIGFGACAIVATSDVLFGMSRMLEMRAERAFTATRVFRGHSEAEAWLAGETP